MKYTKEYIDKEIETIISGGALAVSSIYYLNALEEIKRLHEAERWIPVSERLPEVNTRMSLFDKKTGFSVYGSMQEWRDDRYLWKTDVGEYHFSSITHWKPLPQPPEGE